jgi:hypothetical protein
MAKKLSKREIELASKKAAAEAIEEFEDDIATVEFESPEDRDTSLVDEMENSLTDQEAERRDAFVSAESKAQLRNTFMKSRFYVNGEWIGTIDGPYSWERFAEDHLDVHGQVKVTIVDGNNKFLGSQSMRIARKSSGQVKNIQEQTSNRDTHPLEMLELMKENQREAESKAQSQQVGIATIMQTVMAGQQENSRLMMTMQQENNKQFQTLIMTLMTPKGPDPVIGLLTTLLTQKPKDENGFTTAAVLKMIQDAETRAESRAFKTQEQIDKKANELADIKAEAMSAGEGEEPSGLSGIIKGFLPVMTQMMANQQAQAQANQPTPEQVAQFRELEARRIAGTVEDVVQRKAIPAPQGQRPQPRPVQPVQSRPVQPVAAQPVQTVAPLAVTVPMQPHDPRQRGQMTAPSAETAAQIDPVTLAASQDQALTAAPVELVIDAKTKDRIFEFCAGDIGNAMLQAQAASKTAIVVLDKLEKEGLPRQTVAKTFSLTDFYGYADKYGLPEEAKPWLKEFHEAIQAATGAQPVRAGGGERAAVSGQRSAVSAQPSVNAGNGAAKPLAGKRVTETRKTPGAGSKQPAKNI